MLRGEAIQVLREIIRVCTDSGMYINYVCLNAASQGIGLMDYQLKIGTKLNHTCRTGLTPLLKEKNLEMVENEDHLVVHSPQ